MFPFTKEPNPEVAMLKLLKASAVKISVGTINAELEKHPDYPGFFVSGSLEMDPQTVCQCET